MKAQDKDFKIESVGEKAVDHANEILKLRITEQEKTRRLLIIITAILIVFAACIMVFGPDGRQAISTIIGVILLVFALGSIGAAQFVIKAGGWEVSTNGKGSVEKNDPTSDVTSENDKKEKSKPGYTSAS
jgi:hypothetical protein